MDISNQTCYDTKSIQSLISAIYRKISRKEGPLKGWKNLFVKIGYLKNYSYYEGKALEDDKIPKIWLNLSEPKRGRWTATTRSTAALIEHELLHLYDLDHDDMAELDWDREAIESEYDEIVKKFGSEFLHIKS